MWRNDRCAQRMRNLRFRWRVAQIMRSFSRTRVVGNIDVRTAAHGKMEKVNLNII